MSKTGNGIDHSGDEVSNDEMSQRGNSDDDDDDGRKSESPSEPLPIYQKRDNFYS